MNTPQEKGIIRPRLIKNLNKKKAVYFPLDTPSGSVLKIIKKNARKKIQSLFGDYYLLPGTVILHRSLGAPSAVLSLEPLIVSGVREIMVIAFCGSLNPEFRMMNAVSVTKALSEEGASRHYLPQKKVFRPSLLLKKRIENILRSANLPFLTGSVVSTDAPLRETRSWLKKNRDKGIDVVDMETSAVFALAEFYGIRAAALLIISDELWSGTWKAGFQRPEFEKKIREYFAPILQKGWRYKNQSQETGVLIE